MLRLKRNAGRWAALLLGICLALLLLGSVLQSPARAAEAEQEVQVGFAPPDQVIQIPEGDTTGEYAIALLGGDGTEIEKSPGTGDDSRTILWAAIMLVSFCCIVLCVILMARKKKSPVDNPVGEQQSENVESEDGESKE